MAAAIVLSAMSASRSLLPMDAWSHSISSDGRSRNNMPKERIFQEEFSRTMPIKIWRGSPPPASEASRDRKSTRLNSSHVEISYAVFCLKKKKHHHHLIDPCDILALVVFEIGKETPSLQLDAHQVKLFVLDDLFVD